jgi:phenylalanine-4-hydroxylase
MSNFNRVELAHDHPGFFDESYRARRDAIAELAYRGGGALLDVEYACEEHALWAALAGALDPLHARFACAPIREAGPVAALARDRVPQLREVSARLEAATDFRLRAVAGLVPPREFFAALADGVFLSTQYIRHASRPHYTPEPDIVHELFGHAASLADPRIATLNRKIGAAGRVADETMLLAIERVYWFTIEFGLVLEEGVPKALGAGLLSSVAELRASCERFGDGLPELAPFSLEEIAATPFNTGAPQRVLFLARSFDALATELDAWLDSLLADAPASGTDVNRRGLLSTTEAFAMEV